MSDLLNLVLAAHGGMDCWKSVRAINVRFNLYGGLLELKGYAGHRQPVVSIDPTKAFSEFRYLDGDPDHRWYFTPQKVWIEDAAAKVVSERINPRSSFTGHVRDTPWDQLHLLYFFGYAMWNYLTTPFLFARSDFSTRELESHREDGEVWRVLEVNYPETIPAHTKTQQFYFDATGTLKRIDYVTDLIGGVGAHYCYDPKRVDGVLIPTLRRVVRRTADGPKISGPTSFVLDYVDIAIKRD